RPEAAGVFDRAVVPCLETVRARGAVRGKNLTRAAFTRPAGAPDLAARRKVRGHRRLPAFVRRRACITVVVLPHPTPGLADPSDPGAPFYDPCPAPTPHKYEAPLRVANLSRSR